MYFSTYSHLIHRRLNQVVDNYTFALFMTPHSKTKFEYIAFNSKVHKYYIFLDMGLIHDW